MRQDQQTYPRGANAAAIGLVVQVLIAVTTLLTAFWCGQFQAEKALRAETMSFFMLAYYMFAGIPVWIILWMIYNQHRLERLEAFETEQISRGQGMTAALFDEHADDLNVARRRLNNLYKYGLSTVSVLVGLSLYGLGAYYGWKSFRLVVHYAGNQLLTAADPAAEAAMRLATVMIAVVFVSFVAARYVAGMTNIKEWRLLRGGAGFLMGNAFVAGLAGICALASKLGLPALFSYLPLTASVLLILLAVEMTLSLLLSAYRPRKPGEVPKPAFESRVLGWLTSPESIAKIINETINYQFGFEVSRSWFYKLLGQAIAPLLVFGVISLVAISSIVVVNPGEQALILSMGKLVGTGPVGPGIHFKLPWPLGTSKHFSVGAISEVILSSHTPPADGSQPKAILWTNTHGTENELYITAPTPFQQRATALEEGRDVASGMSLAAAEVTVQFRIVDLMKFVSALPDGFRTVVSANGTLRNELSLFVGNMAERRINAYFVGRDIDSLLSSEAVMASEELRRMIQKDVDDAGLGLEITFVSLSTVHPPQGGQVAASFLKQIAALQEQQTAIERAKADAIAQLAEVAGSAEMAEQIESAILALRSLEAKQRDEQTKPQPDVQALANAAAAITAQEAEIERLLTQAKGSAAVTIYSARAFRWAHELVERSKANEFIAELEAYKHAPNYYRQARYLDALASGLAKPRKIVVDDPNQEMTTMRLDFKDSASPLGTFLAPESK